MTPDPRDLLRGARRTLADVVVPALADPFAIEQAKTVLRVLAHLEAVVDEAYPLEHEEAEDLGAFLASVARSLAGDAELAGFRGEIASELEPAPAAPGAPLAGLRAASSRRKRLVGRLVEGPLRARRGTEWERETRAALEALAARELARQRRWMVPKPAKDPGGRSTE